MNYMLFFVLLCVPALNATTQESFLRANQLYEHKEYEKALTTYKQISPKSSAAWFNMGNCYFCLHDYPHAMWAWRQSQRANPSVTLYKKAEEQIAIAADLMGISLPQTSAFGYMIKRTPVVYIQVIFLICWLLLLGAIWWYTYCRKNKRLVLLAGLCLAGAVIALYHAHAQSGRITAICIQDAQVRAGPHANYPVITTVKKGSEVLVAKQHNTWCKISYESTIGWIDCSEALSMVS